MSNGAPLVLVSNRGPVTYQDDGSVKRGTGGLATALIGLASHRDAVWIASAMTDGDIEQAEAHGGRAFEIEAPHGGEFRVRFVASDPEAYDRFYNIFANPMLWFIQHYLWDQSNAPDIRRHEVEAFEFGYNVVNEDLAAAIREEIYHGLLANDIIGFHTRSYRRNFLQCCQDLLDVDVDMERGIVHCD